jgi:hypothetical protein
MSGMNHLGKRIAEQLTCIVGQPLWGCGRAADLLWLQFGERHLVPSLRGAKRETGDYALHVQCAWRIVCRQEILSASDLEPAARIDMGLSAFVSEHCPAMVQRIDGDDNGGLSIALSGGCVVEVLPDDDSEEQWRLLQPGKNIPHLVLVGTELTEA